LLGLWPSERRPAGARCRLWLPRTSHCSDILSGPCSLPPSPPRPCSLSSQILLLEHGIGTWGFVNDILDRSAGKHFDKWGCWYNRDLESIVTAAGLVVRSRARWHFGTTYVYECEPAEPGVLAAARAAHRRE